MNLTVLFSNFQNDLVAAYSGRFLKPARDSRPRGGAGRSYLQPGCNSMAAQVRHMDGLGICHT